MFLYFFPAVLQKDEVYLNLVLDYVPETVYRVSRHYSRAKQILPMIYVKVRRRSFSPRVTHKRATAVRKGKRAAAPRSKGRNGGLLFLCLCFSCTCISCSGAWRTSTRLVSATGTSNPRTCCWTRKRPCSSSVTSAGGSFNREPVSRRTRAGL